MTKDSPRSTSTDYHLDEQVGYLLRLANQRHAVIFQQLSVLDLTPAQFSVMMRLSEVTRCSQNQLGRLIAMDVATIKGVADRLEKRGFVQRMSDPDDKRHVVLAMTSAGLDVVAQLREMGQAVTRETLSPLTAAQQTTFLRLLTKMI
ncbi:MAG: MarR family transcriptional regulator [Rhodobacteraceae bacterium]|nr:MarR family transcriptional regulator [Paracoccaceae bacterium]